MGSEFPKRRRSKSSKPRREKELDEDDYEDDYEEEEFERRRTRRKRKTSRTKKGRRKSNPAGVSAWKIGVPIGLVLIIAVGAFFVDWGRVSEFIGLSHSHESLIKRQLALQSQMADLLETVKDESSARAIKSKYIRIVKKMADVRVAGSQLRGKKALSMEEGQKLIDKYREEGREGSRRLRSAVMRLSAIPNVIPVMKEINKEASAEANKIFEKGGLPARHHVSPFGGGMGGNQKQREDMQRMIDALRNRQR